MTNREKILKAKPEEEILIKHDYIEKVRFFSNSSDEYVREHLYSWVAYTTSEYYHRTIFPMRNSTYVAFFKTLEGAKRNFIRVYLKER